MQQSPILTAFAQALEQQAYNIAKANDIDPQSVAPALAIAMTNQWSLLNIPVTENNAPLIYKLRMFLSGLLFDVFTEIDGLVMEGKAVDLTRFKHIDDEQRAMMEAMMPELQAYGRAMKLACTEAEGTA